MKRARSFAPTVLALTLVVACGGDTRSSTQEQAAQPPETATTRTAPSETGHGAGHDDEHDAGHESAAVDRTIEVVMVDHAYRPDEFRVKAGETVRFVFHNRGTELHEAILADEAEQNHHERQMQELGRRMEHHDETGHPVEPGKSTELIHTFKRGERLLFGCHFPGHYQAGMRAPITVE